MSLEERVYSLLVVSAAEQFNTALTALLPPSTYSPVIRVTSVSAAKQAMAERAFDLVLINAPLPDDVGLRLAMDSCGTNGTVVLLLLRNDSGAGMSERAIAQGVFVLLKPTSRSALTQALQWMISARERLRKWERKTLPLEEKMAEIRLVNRAKWLLVSRCGMTEPEAHHYLERQAMDRCVSKRVVAEEILRDSSPEDRFG